MLGELTWEDKSDGSLDLSGSEDSLVIISNETAGFSGDLLEGIVDQRVQDGDGSLADTDLGVNLFQDSDDVSAIRLHSLVMSLDNLLGRFCNNFLNSHDENSDNSVG